MGKELYTAAQFIQAIKGSGGIVTTIAMRVGCAWNTAHKYILTHPTVARAYSDECESILDMAEGTLLKSIRNGDSQDSKWYLTKKGKHRGYGESVDLGGAINIQVEYVNDPIAPAESSSGPGEDRDES